MKSRYVELYALVFGAFIVLAFWGTNAQGQGPLFGNSVRQYIEEKALALTLPQYSPVTDITTMMAGVGIDSSVSSTPPEPSLGASTVQESALIAFAPPDASYIEALNTRRAGITQYTVQDGDQLSFIASDFGVSVQSILWANNLKNANSIAPGQVLRIPPVSGVIHVAKSGDSAVSLAKRYGVAEDAIIAYNHLPKDGRILTGESLIIPGGKMPAAAGTQLAQGTTSSKLTVASILESGVPITPALIKRFGTYTQAGSQLTAKLFDYLPDLGGYFITPTNGFNWGILHERNGVDQASPCGTPIVAAAAGVVSGADSTGWNGGFGRYVKISHPNGTETLYGHASKILVKSGQVVSQGEKIALVGTTGKSTGCHVHFEVHGARNPLAKY